MKTSHQFARELLAGPDLPIAVCDPQAEEREEVCHEPQTALIEGFDAENGGDECEMLEIYGHCAVLAPLEMDADFLDPKPSAQKSADPGSWVQDMQRRSDTAQAKIHQPLEPRALTGRTRKSKSK